MPTSATLEFDSITREYGRFFQRNLRTAVLILFVAALLVWEPSPVSGQDSLPLWKINVQQEYGLRDFGTVTDRLWAEQQGVVFMGTDRVALYQVNENLEPSTLARRDASGGAGNFKMDLKIFDAATGRASQQFRFPTSAAFSSIAVLPKGRFIVRTGDVMYLCSPDLKVLATRRLLLRQDAPIEYWQVKVNPAGTQIVLLHLQVYSLPDLFPTPREGRAESDFEVLNPETLETVQRFRVPHYLVSWSPGDGFLVMPNPTQIMRLGFMDFSGQWTSLPAAIGPCAFRMSVAAGDAVAASGCGDVVVLSRDGKTLFSAKLTGSEFVLAIDANEQYLVVETGRHEKYFSPLLNQMVDGAKPVRLKVYDWKNNRQVISVPLRSLKIQFALSTNGSLAIMDGLDLSFFRTGT